MAKYAIWLRRDDGIALQLIDKVEWFEYSKVANDVGACTLVLPGNFDISMLAPDRRIEIWRDGGLENVYFLRYIRDVTEENGRRRFEIMGYDPNYILNSRIVAYAAGSTYANKTDQADDMMKAVVRENLSSLALTAARRLSSTYFAVELDLSLGPSETITFAYANVLSALQEIAKAAYEDGTPVYFAVVPVTTTQFEFRTYINQPGTDHTYPSSNPPVIMSIETGHLIEASFTQDWSHEVTYVYAGGQGDGAARTVISAEDATRSGRSIFGRREAFKDARNDSTDNGVATQANARLKEGRPILRLTPRLSGRGYGSEWSWGDKVSINYQNQQKDVVITGIKVKMDGGGKETLDIKVDIEE